MMENETFADRMRRRKRVATTLGEKLIILKFVFAIGTDDVYAETVLAFGEIYKFLENAMRAQQGSRLGRLLINGLARTNACLEDLNNYMGSNWVIPYRIREPTLTYLMHLQRLYLEDPDLLIPYVYHLYMELLCGGQLLKTRKELDRAFNHQGEILGTALVDFGEHDPLELRRRLSRELNRIAEDLDEAKKERLIREGTVVYQYANHLLGTLESVDRLMTQRFIFLCLCILGITFAYYFATY